MTQLLFQPLDDKVEFASLEKSEQAMVQFFRDNAAVDIDYKRLSKMALVYMSDTLQKWKQEADRLSQTSCRAPRFHPSEDNDGVCRRLSKSHFPFDRRLIDIPELDDSIAHIESEAALEAVLSGDSAHEDLLELTAARTHGSSTSQHASSSSTIVANAEKSAIFSASLTGLQKISMGQQHQRAVQSLPHLLQVPKSSIKQSNYKTLLKPERCEIHTREELLDYVRMPHRGPVGEKVAPVMFVKIHKLDSTEILQATASAWIDSIVRVQCWDHDALQYIYRVFLHIGLEPSVLAGYVYGCRIAMSDFHGMLSYFWINRYMFSPKPMDPSELVPASELPRIPTLFQLDKSNYEISCHPNVRYGVKIKGNRVYLQIMSLADFRFASSAHMLDRFSRAHNDNLIKLFRLIPDKKSFDIAVQVGMIPTGLAMTLIDFSFWTDKVLTPGRVLTDTSLCQDEAYFLNDDLEHQHSGPTMVSRETKALFTSLNKNYFPIWTMIRRDLDEQMKYNPVMVFLTAVSTIFAITGILQVVLGVLQVIQQQG